MPLYNYNSSNELTSSSLGSYSYDNNGNTLSDPNGRTYVWDFENRLTSVFVPGTGTVTFKYDPFGRRIQKSSPLRIANFVYSGRTVAAEIDSLGNATARYAQGPRIDEPLAESSANVTSYYEQDGLGSITSLGTASGSLANSYVYSAFGGLVSSTGTVANPISYTGREFDSEVGLHYYRARYYDPAVGRFVSQDPAGIIRGGINPYKYVGNDPHNFSDPSGLCKVDIRFWQLGPGWYHAYIVLTSPDGSQYYFRAGPSAGGPSSGTTGQLGSGSSGSSSGSASGSSNSSQSSNSSSPGASPKGGGGYDPWGALTAQGGAYLPGTIDWDPGNPATETLEDDNLSCECIKNSMQEYANAVNSANIAYNPFSTNSNAFAFGAAGAGGFVPPSPPVWAPGSGTPLPIH